MGTGSSLAPLIRGEAAEVKLHLFELRSPVDVGPRIEFGFDFSALCRTRGRGSPRFGAARRPLGSKKSKRPVVSHRWKGDSVHFGPLYE